MDKPAPIDLATAPDFVVGNLAVRPSLLEVAAGGTAHPVPPRVMQVLVALASADGRTVSRDELAQRCWDRRVVGEDALNRIIAKLRAVAEDQGAGSFAIETVKRVGYRLVVPGDAGRVTTTPVQTSTSPPARWPLVAGSVAVVLAALVWLASALMPPASKTDGPVIAAAADMETRGLSAVFEDRPDRTAEGIAYLREATAANPGDAPVWGSLAMAYVLSLPDTPADGRDAVVARIREAARRAQALDRREGRSIAALTSLVPTFANWSNKDKAQKDGLAQATPGSAPLIFQRALFLADIGQTAEALHLVDQLHASSPLVPWIQSARINLLAANGRLDEAERVADWAGGVWPRNRLIWFTRFDLAAFGGQPRKALAMAANCAPAHTDAQELALAVAAARAIESRLPADADTVIAAYRRVAPTGQGHAGRAMRAAAALGRPREALAFADILYGADLPPGPRDTALPRIGLAQPGERNTAILFVPPVAGLWAQPGFAALATQVGLVDYWRKTGPPDLCAARAIELCAALR